MTRISHLGVQEYTHTWLQMQQFTLGRTATTTDELWLLEHYPVYTQGQAGKAEHVLNLTTIPIVQSDRGGQITYHGPGQLIVYVLVDLIRRALGIRTLVLQLEEVLRSTLADYQIPSHTRRGAPGVYVEGQKIASLGLRVKKGCTYHGLALNVAMDLSPFQDINPCGFAAMKMTQISHFVPLITLDEVQKTFVRHFINHFEQ